MLVSQPRPLADLTRHVAASRSSVSNLTPPPISQHSDLQHGLVLFPLSRDGLILMGLTFWKYACNKSQQEGAAVPWELCSKGSRTFGCKLGSCSWLCPGIASQAWTTFSSCLCFLSARHLHGDQTTSEHLAGQGVGWVSELLLWAQPWFTATRLRAAQLYVHSQRWGQTSWEGHVPFLHFLGSPRDSVSSG